MAVVGLDMGNFSSYIGVARAGGIEIIANEYSDRLTPTYVTFDKSTRTVGQASKAMEITNAKNTISNFKRLLGRRYHDTFVQQEKEMSSYSIVDGKGGSVNIEVNYLNERKRFTPEQIAAMMFSKLKHITNTESATKPVDCVIGVPCFFTDAERRAMLDAAQIAGWNCLRLLNETAAVALCYGIYKADLPEPTEKPRLVVFVDLGYTALQTSVVALNKGKLKIIATAFDPSLGGRDFDRTIMDAMRDDFKKRYKVESYSTVKSKLRLRAECEKAKKSMSSNTQAIPISLECLIDEKDVSGKMSRVDFEELAKPLLERIRTTLVNLLKEAQITVDDVESVEIVGGSTRIPCVKQVVQETFRQVPMTTMNADESVARGCALMCAILSPTFKVKEFKLEDCQPYPITLSWQGGINEDNEVEVFTRWNPVSSTKILSFYRKEPFTITARYSYPNDIPFSESRIGQYTIEQVQPQPDGTPSRIKVKVRLSRSGLCDVTQAAIVEADAELTDTNPEQTLATTNEPTEEANTIPVDPHQEKNDEGDESKKSTPRKKAKEIDLPITARVSGATKSELERLITQELEMNSQDRKEKECSDAKNAVEEYVYDMREKLERGEYAKYSDEKTRQKLLQDLRSTEKWLYEEAVSENRDTYLERLKSLKNLGEPIRNRCNEAENRPYHMQEFLKALQRVNEAIQIWQTKSNEKYSHLDKTDMEKVFKILYDKQKWYDQTAQRFNSLKPHDNPAVLCSQIKQDQETFERDSWTILNKPKPKVDFPKETSADSPRKQAPPPPPPSSNKKSTQSKTPNQQASMDVN